MARDPSPLAALRAGHAVEAERRARRVLRERPDDATAHYVLGVVALGRGEPGRAADAFRAAAAADPGNADLLVQLTEAERQAGRIEAAVAAGRAAVERAPGSAPAHNNLGLALEAAGGRGEAESVLRRAVELDPRHAKAHLNLGNLLREAKRFAAAEASLRAALAARPDYPQAWNSLGVVLGDLGRLPEASDAFHRALELAPRYTKPLTNLGKLFLELERWPEALECFEGAERRDRAAGKPASDALVLQAQALHRMRRGPEALERLRRAARAAPESAAPHFEAGAIEFARFAFDRSLAAFRRAAALDPAHLGARANVHFAQAQVCDWRDWREGFERLREDVACELAAGRSSPLPPHSTIFFPFTAAEQLAVARRHAETIAERAAKLGPPPAPRASRVAGRRIRVGYLSMDYRDNALAHLARRLFSSHDRERFEAIALSFGPDDRSAWRRGIESTAERFVELERLPAAEAARRIRALDLDLLVDLAGFAGNARPEIVALRPAPLQALWLYPGTGGGLFHDLLVGDATITPEGEDAWFGERIVRLPGTFQLTDGAPPVAERRLSRADCGLPETGVVFCAFNQFAKISPDLFAVWMRLLARVPGSVLWLQALVPAGRENLRRAAASAGVDPARLVFAPLVPKPLHLARHAHADLFLDTRYCNAHTTASDALRMGVPVVTCPWPTYAGRVAASLVRAAGVGELAVDSLEAYEELAFALATDGGRRVEVRARIAAAGASGGPFDTRRRVAAWEDAIRDLLAGVTGHPAP